VVLTSWTLTLAFVSAAEVIADYLQISSLLLGCSTGVLIGFTTYYIVDETTVQRLSIGLLGLVSSSTVVIDVTGQFFVFDGFARVPGMIGTILALGVILHTISGDSEAVVGIRYIFVGLVCLGVAATGLALEWVLGSGAVRGIARPQGWLLLVSGLAVLSVELSIWGDADSAVSRE
jgi:hypothetical protein